MGALIAQTRPVPGEIMNDKGSVRPTERRRPRAKAPTSGRTPSKTGANRVTKALVRALERAGSRSDRSPKVARRVAAVRDQTVCGACGAVFVRKTWRRSSRRLQEAMVQGALPGVCPACRQVVNRQAFGRVILEGSYVELHAAELLRRIDNVAMRAAFTQPERRLIGIDTRGSTVEVLTTSQKLAHRIARELEKAFRGSVSYHWSDGDGRLLATWHRDQ
jgi:hypothetical protein